VEEHKRNNMGSRRCLYLDGFPTKIAKEHGKVEELMVGIVDDIITNL